MHKAYIGGHFFGCYGTLFTCRMPDKNLPEVYDNTFCTLTMSSCPVPSREYVQSIHDSTSASNIYSDIVIMGSLLEYNEAVLHIDNYMEQENPTAESGFENISFDDN